MHAALLSGAFPAVLRWCGVAALAWLLLHTGRHEGNRRAPAIIMCAIAAVAATELGVHLVRKVWRLFPDALDPPIFTAVALAVFALALIATLAAGQRSVPYLIRIMVAAMIAMAADTNEINLYFGAYPTLADALGEETSTKIPFHALPASEALAPDSHPVSASWTPTSALPDQGRLTSARIPATRSGFAARDAEIYLPPAYFATPRPRLPVLVLLAGQPGAPQDWLTAGGLVRTMDSFAATHGGLAPITVVADGTGGPFANPLCLDSRLANAATYLAADVPAWIRSHLTVDDHASAWAIGGLSYGGTCAVQLATNYPDVYPTFLAFSADPEPRLGSRYETIDQAFAGNEHDYQRVNPTRLLQTSRYPGSAGAFVVGDHDRDGLSGARTLLQTTRAAGMDTHYTELPGGHDWHVWSAALHRELSWLATRLGLVP
ncbi:alpha/beta hydrolase [Nocardia sp. NBC_01327]|uniref:alpha/beta hydrolase n=1 Tax=Nocardia sp. NBC_01327 TaxID=2903593 RepID=UPI002E124E46|nr:esterase family protein [Nocardia sp. NBC_01327]